MMVIIGWASYSPWQRGAKEIHDFLGATIIPALKNNVRVTLKPKIESNKQTKREKTCSKAEQNDRTMQRTKLRLSIWNMRRE